ncbi:MAG: type II toxin-antitoxin system VapC family toxin [Verrucomicrobiales bacterium]
MIVVDTNVLAYLYFPGDKTHEVKDLLKTDPEWAAPVLWRSEFLNVLSTYMRVKGLPFARCIEIFEMADELLSPQTYAVSPLKVLEVSSRTSCSGYDSEFVSLAEELQTRLVTYDARLISKSAPISCPPTEILASA